LGAIGITPKPFYQPKQWMWMAHRGIYEQLEGDVANVVRVFKALLTPKGEKEAGRAAKGLGGPLMIFTILMKLVQHGLWVSLGFMRLICMNLAILNLLPLPVLDGGHILFALYAMIRRKEPSVKVVGMITTCFAFLLISLMLWFLFSDIMRFI
jgi:RIP metalloprotease RseP